MAISQTRLKDEIKKAFDAEKDKNSDQQSSIGRIAARIATVVAEQIAEGINSAAVNFLLASATGGAVSGTITLKAVSGE